MYFGSRRCLTPKERFLFNPHKLYAQIDVILISYNAISRKQGGIARSVNEPILLLTRDWEMKIWQLNTLLLSDQEGV